MHSPTTYLSPIVSLISLWTAAGILMHDVQIDAATVTALSPVSDRREGKTSVQLPDPHTHPEQASQVRSSKNSQPRIQPKRNDYRVNLANRRLKKDDYSMKPPKGLRSVQSLA